MQKKLVFVITGGGTGGHVFPALTIAEDLRRRGAEVNYVGIATGMEARLAPERGIAFFAVKSGAVKNKGAMAKFKTLFLLLSGVLWSFRFLLQKKPDAVIGVGGYVSVPICLAAFLLRIPIFLQEQNTSVGIANRFLGKLATKIFLGFEEAKTYFNASKCLVTGNPLRREILESTRIGGQGDEIRLLVLGGSQGAKSINTVITQLLPKLSAHIPTVRIVHQTGRKDLDWVGPLYEKSGMTGVTIVPFIERIADAYARADFVVARSGALTVSELLAVGLPSLLVPYPRSGQNDQTTNAYHLERLGVARVVEQGENFEARFEEALLQCLSRPTREQMTQRAHGLQKSTRVVSIADYVIKEVSGRHV